MKKALIVLSLVSLVTVTTGCTGSFNLTRKVYQFHHSQSDKWGNEMAFLVCIFLPIYSISTLADALVFNSIQFWTGKNPVQMSSAQSQTKYVKTKEGDAKLSYNPDTRHINIVTKTAQGKTSNITFEKDNDMILAKDQNGKTLYASKRTADGGITVYNHNLELVKRYTPSQVRTLEAKYMK